ncbi:hypothetical protein [uncultured Microscilla sp.]|uniref:hypothetical protein n=1 Tax=uncultured Microscilla sp. TaxID=432653 RepID=UPI002639B67D|nr:hypothetical protein [uncultured Microscilla sp.]
MEKTLRLFLCVLLTIGSSQLYALSSLHFINSTQNQNKIDTIIKPYPVKLKEKVQTMAHNNRFVEVKLNKQIQIAQEGKLLFEDKNISIHEAYPSPADSFTMVKYKASVNNAKILLKNVLGKNIKEFHLPATSDYTQFKIPTNYLRNGVYFYILYIGKKAMKGKRLTIKH